MRNLYLVLLLVVVAHTLAAAQVGLRLPAPAVPVFATGLSPFTTIAALSRHRPAPPLPVAAPPHRTPAAYRYQELAFFCKVEVQLEQAARLPVKFRLGSVDYVDYLEMKK